METRIKQALRFLENKESLLLEGLWGIERESLRITKNADLAQTPHPPALGNKTTHPSITVDFSESQLEFITPPLPSIEKSYLRLKNLQESVYRLIDDEYLWPLSMPGRLPGEADIPVARFDGSPEGNIKEIYRQGLVHRYGKPMQMISGVHYNYSFSPGFLEAIEPFLESKNHGQPFSDYAYVLLARNFLRYRWLLILLFGASPVADFSFMKYFIPMIKDVEKRCSCGLSVDDYFRHTVSLRMSRFGYANPVQSGLKISYDDLGQYISGLEKALTTPIPAYEQIGVFREGKQVQLNANALQVENELYAPVRLKQVLRPGENLVNALKNRGVGYIEVRSIDLNPFDPVGISLQQLYFLHIFLLYCLLEENQTLGLDEETAIAKNNHIISLKGRDAALRLNALGRDTISMDTWGQEIFDKLSSIAEMVDRGRESCRYQAAVRHFYTIMKNRDRLPSARIISEMQKADEKFLDFGIRKAKKYARKGKKYVFQNTRV